MIVYLIFKGKYSDSRVVRVMDDEAAAKEYIKVAVDDTYDGDDFSIIPMEVNSTVDEGFGWICVRDRYDEGKDPHIKIFFIRNKPKPGVPYWLAKVIDPIDDYEYYRKEEVLELCRQTCFSVTELGKVYVFFVTARCKEAALKISNEMFGAVKVMEDQGMLKEKEVYRISDMKDMGENLHDCSI